MTTHDTERPADKTENERVRDVATSISRRISKLSEREQVRVVSLLIDLHAPEGQYPKREA